VRLVGVARVEGPPVDLGEYRHRADPQLLAGAEHPTAISPRFAIRSSGTRVLLQGMLPCCAGGFVSRLFFSISNALMTCAGFRGHDDLVDVASSAALYGEAKRSGNRPPVRPWSPPVVDLTSSFRKIMSPPRRGHHGDLCGRKAKLTSARMCLEAMTSYAPPYALR